MLGTLHYSITMPLDFLIPFCSPKFMLGEFVDSSLFWRSLPRLDLRFNEVELGRIGLFALSNSFRHGALMGLANLNGMFVDKQSDLDFSGRPFREYVIHLTSRALC